MAFLTRDEIVRSITGAWHVFIDRPDADRYFDLSVTGFWRSFRAIVLILPAYALSAATTWTTLPSSMDTTTFFVARTVSLAIDWVAFPIVLALVADRLRVSSTYSAYVIVRNWASVIATTPFAIISILYILGPIGQEVASTLSLAVLFVILRYNYLIARRVLQVGIPLAIGVVVVDFILSLSIDAGISALFGVPIQ
ncbi:MAG: hypothetical protein J0H63_02335 [Rhizobiales bacterium]|nr:hypothetical protein [Hyphomicrobiales bacterium]MBN9009005.1 hypothetical protein [Hyphomicrobiales bacterium]